MFNSVIANLLNDIKGLLGGSSGGGATENGQNIGNASLASIDSKTPALMSGAVPVHVVNQLDISTISGYLLAIKNSCEAIDANTDTVEQKLTDTIAAINANGTVNHADLLAVIAKLQAVNANTNGQEALLTSILNKLIAAPATLAEQQAQSSLLTNIDTKTPALIDNKTPVLALDYGLAVSRGLIAGITTKSIMGYNSSTPTTLEPVWSASTPTYPYPTAEITATIQSTSVNDTAAGTGLRTVAVNYLRADFSDVTVVVALNGTTAVTVAADVFRINNVVGLTAGSAGSAVGTVTVFNGANILSRIEATETNSQQVIYTVPANKVFEALAFRPAVQNPARFRFKYRTAGGSLFSTAFNMPLDGSITFTSPFASAFPAGTDIEMQAQSLGGTIQTGMIISGFLRSV